MPDDRRYRRRNSRWPALDDAQRARVECYVPLAVSLANRWRARWGLHPRSPAWGDIMGAAFLGLCQAAARPGGRVANFGALARERIRGEILNEWHRYCRGRPAPARAASPPDVARDARGDDDDEADGGRHPGLMDAFRGLSARDQELIELAVWREHPFPEIAGRLGYRCEAGPRAELRRALGRLRDAYRQ